LFSVSHLNRLKIITQSDKRKILVAPLNWGLGHATRCIPIINALIDQQFEPIIASDGDALRLLRKEFPQLKRIELPSYNITYPKNGHNFKLKLLKDSPHVLNTIKKEKNRIKKILEEEEIHGIISDNRFGVRHKSVPSVFISHQVRVLSGSTTWLSTKFHQNIISKFDECWVPDEAGEPNLSGKLGHTASHGLPIKYIGPLSRFSKYNVPPKYKILVLLSGPEPQRSLLAEKLLALFSNYTSPVCFVKGVVEEEQTTTTIGSLTVHNFLTASDLEYAINASELVISRSGYTTIMDLAKLGKKAFFIPTPGQFEQEYLAAKLNADRIAPCCSQRDFTVDKLNLVQDYNGFNNLSFSNDFRGMFDLFERKGELASHA
jgi:uncharacterized protein (TIGR00661 family)